LANYTGVDISFPTHEDSDCNSNYTTTTHSPYTTSSPDCDYDMYHTEGLVMNCISFTDGDFAGLSGELSCEYDTVWVDIYLGSDCTGLYWGKFDYGSVMDGSCYDVSCTNVNATYPPYTTTAPSPTTEPITSAPTTEDYVPTTTENPLDCNGAYLPEADALGIMLATPADVCMKTQIAAWNYTYSESQMVDCPSGNVYMFDDDSCSGNITYTTYLGAAIECDDSDCDYAMMTFATNDTDSTDGCDYSSSYQFAFTMGCVNTGMAGFTYADLYCDGAVVQADIYSQADCAGSSGLSTTLENLVSISGAGGGCYNITCYAAGTGAFQSNAPTREPTMHPGATMDPTMDPTTDPTKEPTASPEEVEGDSATMLSVGIVSVLAAIAHLQ